ncbi:hypothetical protein JCM10296v2_004105 [Rhodotorula toruloides]
MRGLLQAALPQTAPAPLSSTNLASHTRSNPPAPRRTVTHYVLQQAPYVSRTAQEGYEVGPPPSDEFEGVKTPPRAREAGRKRALEEVEGSDSGPRKRKDEALVLLVDDGQFARPRGSESTEVKRKKPLLAMQLKGRSSSASATPVAGSSRPPGKDVEPSPSSSFLVPRAGALEVLDAAPAKPSRKAKGKGKENEAEPARKASPKKRKGRLRAEAEEADELDEVEERLRARRERRRERALIRKDRTVTSAAVGAAAASKVKAAQKKQRGGDASSSDEHEGTRRKSKRKRESKDEVVRRKVQELDKPSGVKAGRLTLKPAPQLGIFNRGKASVRTKVGKTIGDLAFSELAFLDAPRCAPSSPSSASPSSSSSSRSDAEDVRLKLSAARPTGPRTYGSGRRGSARASKHFAALIDDVQPASLASPAVVPTKTARSRSPQPNFWIEIPSRPASSLARQRQHLHAQPAASFVTNEASTHPSVLSAASLVRRKRAKKDLGPAAGRADQLREEEEFLRPTLYAPLGALANVGAEAGNGDLGGTDQADHNCGTSTGVEEVREASETEIGTVSLARMLDEVRSEQPDGGLAESQEQVFAQLEAEEGAFARSLLDQAVRCDFVEAGALGESVSAVHAIDSFDLSASFVDLPASNSALLFGDGLYYDAAAAQQTGVANYQQTDSAFPPISSAASSFADTAFHDVPTLGHSTTLAEHRETNRGGMYADDVEFREAMRRQWPKARC